MDKKPSKPRVVDVLKADRKLALHLQKRLLELVKNQIVAERGYGSWQPTAAAHWHTTVATMSRWAAGIVPMQLPAFVKMIAAISTDGLLDALADTAKLAATLKAVPPATVQQIDKARAKVTRRATAKAIRTRNKVLAMKAGAR